MACGAPPVEKLENVQALRGVAVLLVVFYHLHGLEEFYVAGPHLLPDLCRIGGCGVDLFFVISGLVMVVSTQGRFGSWQEARRFFVRRALRIYPLFWVFSLATMGVYLLPAGQASNVWGEVNLLASVALWPQEITPLLIVSWTLWHELYFYGVFGVLLSGREQALRRGLVLWVVALVMAGGLYWWWQQAVSPLRIATDPMTLEFIAGCLMGQVLIRGGCRKWGALSLVAGFVLWGLAWWFYPVDLDATVPDRWLRLAFLGIPAMLVLYGGVALERGRRWRMPRWLVRIGYASYSIYLSHMLVLAVGRRMWFAVIDGGHIQGAGWLDLVDNGVALTGLLALVLAVGGLSYRLIEQWLAAATRRLLSSR